MGKTLNFLCYERLNPYRITIPFSEVKDEHCLSMQRFLFEADYPPNTLKQQYDFFENNFDQFNRVVYSGNKSLHFVLEISKDCMIVESKEMYKSIWHSIFSKVKDECDILFDRATSHPSVMTRKPGRTNADTGRLQKLLYQNDEPKFIEIPKIKKKYKFLEGVDRTVLNCNARLSDFDKTVLSGRIEKGNRNNAISAMCYYLNERGLNVADYSNDLEFAYPDMKREIRSIVDRYRR